MENKKTYNSGSVGYFMRHQQLASSRIHSLTQDPPVKQYCYEVRERNLVKPRKTRFLIKTPVGQLAMVLACGNLIMLGGISAWFLLRWLTDLTEIHTQAIISEETDCPEYEI